MKAFLFGWLIMPILVSATINSLIPKDVKAINDSFNEISQSANCKLREMYSK